MEQVSIKYLRCGQVVGHTSFNLNMINDYTDKNQENLTEVTFHPS